MDGIKGVVCDIGSKVSKVGFAGEPFPRKVFPSAIGRFRQAAGFVDAAPDLLCGHEALQHRGTSELCWPVRGGAVRSWPDLESLWYHMYYANLYQPPEESRIMCVVHPLTTSKDKAKMAEILFESFTVRALYVGLSPALVLFASGLATGVVWEGGAQCCHTTPVFEGFPLSNAIVSSPLTGDAMTSVLLKMLSDLGYSFTTPNDIQAVEEIKESQCFVAPDFAEQAKNPYVETLYTLPDGQTITIGDPKFRCPEVLFQPSIGGFNCPGVIDNIFTSVGKVDLDVRDVILENVVLAGGSSLFSGLEARVASELKSHRRGRRGAARGAGRVVAEPARAHAAWAGGSMLASLHHTAGLWMTAAEYNDGGPNVVNQKFF